MISIEKFCDLHNACRDGRVWALGNCKTMADVWATACPGWLVWVATRPGVLDDRMLRLFAADCARSVEHLLTDDRSRNAIDVAERFANGGAAWAELNAALVAASDAAREVAWDASRKAPWDARDAAAWAASVAASVVAWHPAWDAAWDAASDAASDAAREAAREAARDAASAATSAARDAAAWDARERQAIWLRQHCTPNFSEGGE